MLQLSITECCIITIVNRYSSVSSLPFSVLIQIQICFICRKQEHDIQEKHEHKCKQTLIDLSVTFQFAFCYSIICWWKRGTENWNIQKSWKGLGIRKSVFLAGKLWNSIKFGRSHVKSFSNDCNRDKSIWNLTTGTQLYTGDIFLFFLKIHSHIVL